MCALADGVRKPSGKPLAWHGTEDLRQLRVAKKTVVGERISGDAAGVVFFQPPDLGDRGRGDLPIDEPKLLGAPDVKL